MTISCKENNGETSYFLSDGPINYRNPLKLEKVDAFPVLYNLQFQPSLLVYKKIVVNASSPKFSEVFSISHLKESEHSIQVVLQEQLSIDYEPVREELVKYVVMNE